MDVVKLLFKRPYRPIAQTVYYAVLGLLGGVLLIVGQPWAIGLTVLGAGGVVVMGAGAAWRHRHPS
jgi:hypothetical protein